MPSFSLCRKLVLKIISSDRAIHVAKFEEAVYVLHCFKKKTQKTNQRDKDLAQARYKDVLQERSKK